MSTGLAGRMVAKLVYPVGDWYLPAGAGGVIRKAFATTCSFKVRGFDDAYADRCPFVSILWTLCHVGTSAID